MKHLTLAFFTIVCVMSTGAHADMITFQTPGTGGTQSTALANFYTARGFTVNNIASGTQLSLAALSGSHLFFAMLPSDDYTATEINALSTYVSTGGHVFFMGDNGNVSGLVAGNNRINAALTGIGSSLQLANTLLDANSHLATTANGQVIVHGLTMGVDTVSYAAVSGITGVSSGEGFLLASDLSSVFGASDSVGLGRVTLMGDINAAGFINAGNDNGALFLNIASVPEPSGLACLATGVFVLASRRNRRKLCSY